MGPELVDPRGVTTLGEYRALNAEDLRDARAEGQGILRGGSAISDWIRVVGELALAFKKAGVPRVALIVLTDGWNRNGHIQNHISRRWQNASEALAKDTINKLRQAFIAFHLIGFLRITDRENLERFVASIDLRTGDGPGNSAKEVEINCYDPDNRGSIEDSVSRSLETSRHTFSRTVAP